MSPREETSLLISGAQGAHQKTYAFINRIHSAFHNPNHCQKTPIMYILVSRLQQGPVLGFLNSL